MSESINHPTSIQGVEALTPTEALPIEVIGYLLATSFLFNGIGARDYTEACVYENSHNQPAAKILRHNSYYVDGCIGIQDETCMDGNRYQLNFEVDAKGKLIKHPTKISRGVSFLSKKIEECSTIPKSSIMVGNRIKYYSFGKGWYTPEAGETKDVLDKRCDIIQAGRSQTTRLPQGSSGPFDAYCSTFPLSADKVTFNSEK